MENDVTIGYGLKTPPFLERNPSPIFAYLFIGFENIFESDYNFIVFYEVRTFVDERTVLIFFSFQTGISFHVDLMLFQEIFFFMLQAFTFSK